MSDLLAKCDWDEDELHVYIAEWPEVVYVWVDEKTMPYAPVVADVRSLQVEIKELQELVRHMRCCSNREYTEHGIDFIATRCEDCEYDNASGRCDFDSRMRELGVEL